MDNFLNILRETWLVTAAMAPWLLLGFLVAGLLSVWISPRWLEAHLGGRGLAPVAKAALFGVPLPLCSCGVIPVGASLRRSGASRAATTAFLLSTPQTGVDSVAITYSLLGPLVAVVRPLVALVTGLLGGAVVAAVAGEPDAVGPAGGQRRDDRPHGSAARVRGALAYGLGVLPGDIGKPLLVGVAIAGALSALVPRDYLAQYLGGGVVSILVLMAVGVPLYVCATASVPIAAGFIHLGVSPGAALAFLIAGPATNAATITTVWQVLGRRTALVYLGAVVVSAVGGGLLLNELLVGTGATIPGLEHGAHVGHSPSWFHHAAAVFLLVVVCRALGLIPGVRRPVAETPGQREKGNGMAAQRIELDVQGMECSHCSGSVRRILEDLPGVVRVVVDLDRGRAVVEGNDLASAALTGAVNGIGYRAQMVRES